MTLLDTRMSYRYLGAAGECRLRLFNHLGRYVALMTDVSGLSTTNAYEEAAGQVYRTYRSQWPMLPDDLLPIAHRLPDSQTGWLHEHFTYHPLHWDAKRAAYALEEGEGWHHPTREEVVDLCGEPMQ